MRRYYNRSRQTGTVNPAHFSSVTLEYDAAKNQFSDAGSTLVAADGNIQQANPTIGSGNLIQTTADNKPTWRTAVSHGQPCMRFAGTNDLLRTTTAPTGASGHIFIVFRLSATGASQVILASADEATALYYLYFGVYSNDTLLIGQKNNDTIDAVTGSSIVAQGQTYIAEFVSSGTAYTMFLNGVAQTLTAQSGANNGDWFSDVAGRDNLTVGALKTTSESAHFTGDVFHVLNCAALAQGQIDAVRRYLSQRYGVDLNNQTGRLDGQHISHWYNSGGQKFKVYSPGGVPLTTDIALSSTPAWVTLIPNTEGSPDNYATIEHGTDETGEPATTMTVKDATDLLGGGNNVRTAYNVPVTTDITTFCVEWWAYYDPAIETMMPENDLFTHWRMIFEYKLNDASPHRLNAQFRRGGTGTDLFLQVRYRNAGGVIWSVNHTPTTFPAGRWVYHKIYVELGTPAGVCQFWFDDEDTPVISSTNATTNDAASRINTFDVMKCYVPTETSPTIGDSWHKVKRLKISDALF